MKTTILAKYGDMSFHRYTFRRKKHGSPIRKVTHKAKELVLNSLEDRADRKMFNSPDMQELMNRVNENMAEWLGRQERKLPELPEQPVIWEWNNNIDNTGWEEISPADMDAITAHGLEPKPKFRKRP